MADFLSGYNIQNQINQQRNMGEFQQGTAAMGILGQIQAQQQAAQIRGILSANAPADVKAEALSRTPGGLTVLKQLNDMKMTQQHGALYSAQIADYGRKAADDATKQGVLAQEQAYKAALIPQLKQPQYNGEMAPGGPAPQLFPNDAAAMEAMKQAEVTGTPFRAAVNNPNVTQALVAGAGNSLPARVSSDILKNLNPPAPSMSAQVAAGNLAERKRQNDYNLGSAPAAASAATATPSDSNTPELPAALTFAPQKVKDQWLLKNTPNPGAAAFSPAALETAGWEKLLFGVDPKGMGTASSQQRAQVANERTRIGQSLGLTPTEMAMMPKDNNVKMKAVDKLTTWGAFVDKAADQLTPSIDLAIEYAKKFDPTTLQTLNKAIIAGKTEFNDPATNGYAVAVNTVRREYGRLMSGPTSNAMLPVEAMKSSDHLISGALDVPSWREVKSVIMRDAGFTKDAVQKQIQSLRSGITNPSGAPLPTNAVTAPGTQPAALQQVQRATSKSGKAMHMENNQWVYD